MARYEPSRNNVIFHPTNLRLNSNSHRASLDQNDVAVLSGRDPDAVGSIRRMPGGKDVTGTDFPDESSYAYRSHFFQRRGVIAGATLRSKTTSAITPATGTVNVPLQSGAGFEVNDWVAVYSTANCMVSRITAISGNTLSVNSVAGGSSTTQIPSGSLVIRCVPIFDPGGSDPPTASDTTVDMFPSGIQIGQTFTLIGHRDGSTQESVTIANISGMTVTFTAALSNTYSPPSALIPSTAAFETSELFVSQANGNVERVAAGVWKKIWDASDQSFAADEPWSMALYDRSIIATNGNDRPRRVTIHTDTFNPAASGQKPPGEYVGFPPDPGSTTSAWSATGSGTVTAGAHRVFFRFADKSVFPYAYGPPIGATSITASGSNLIQLDLSSLINMSSTPTLLNGTQEGNRRATHIQIYMTTAGGADFVLVHDHHISYYMRSATNYGQFSATFQVNVTDAQIVVTASIGDNILGPYDYTKGLMPVGKFVHYGQGVMMTFGVSGDDHNNEYPRVLSGNTLHFSRVDVTEPENFPPLNFKDIGEIGDDLRGAVNCGRVTLLLSRWGFTVVQRAGTVLLFDDGSTRGGGLAYDEAFCSLGSHAAWVSDKTIWLFDGRTLQAPRDIGMPISDWVRELKDADRVRMGFDPVEQQLWVGRIDGDTVADCKIYSFADDSWMSREDVVLDAPASGYGVESSGSAWAMYRFAGAYCKCFRAVDYDNRPLIDGGFTIATTDQFIGTLAGGLSSATQITSLSGLPATNTLRGSVVRFSTGDIRVITASTTTSITWSTALTVAAGTTWIIGCIPFRLRFPPIRGEDPFASKVAYGTQIMVDDVDYGTQGTETATLTAKLFTDFKDDLPTGRTKTLVIGTGAALLATDWAANLQGTGGILEVQFEQLSRHVDFALIYAGLAVSIPGVFGNDRSTAT